MWVFSVAIHATNHLPCGKALQKTILSDEILGLIKDTVGVYGTCLKLSNFPNLHVLA